MEPKLKTISQTKQPKEIVQTKQPKEIVQTKHSAIHKLT